MTQNIIMSDTSKNVENIELERKKITTLGLSGLCNIGNTCFMNSALQCLSSTDLLLFYLIGKDSGDPMYKKDLKNNIIAKILKKKNCEISNITEKEVRKEYKGSLTYNLKKLLILMWNCNCKVKPISFLKNLAEKNNLFMGFSQHDSQECLSYIIDTLHEETKTDVNIKIVNLTDEQIKYYSYYVQFMEFMNNNKNTEEEKNKIYRKHIETVKRQNLEKIDVHISYLYYWKKFIKNNHSLMTDLFTGLFLTEIKCDVCNNSSHRFDPYNIISLPMPIPIPENKTVDDLDIYDCFDKYFLSEEKIEGERHCDYCAKKTETTIKNNLWRTPEKLIIQLKKFTPDGRKFNLSIASPKDELNLDKYYSKFTNKKLRYELYGLIIHIGSLSGGHYVSVTKNIVNNLWYLYDDTNVVHVQETDINNIINSCNTYILFYKKK